MVGTLPQNGVLQVVPPGALDRLEARKAKESADAKAKAEQPSELAMTNLAGYIRTQFTMMVNHRNSQAGWSNRLIEALRTFNGAYDPDKLSEIRKFGGSEAFARITAAKCRGASSLLRDVYLQSDRPWGLDPGPDPAIPPNIMQSIEQLIRSEVAGVQQSGQPVDPAAMRDRLNTLLTAARQAAKKKAAAQAKIAEDKIDEYLVEGGFYKALAEFLVDLPIFPFACIKGPVIRIVPTLNWEQGTAISTPRPRLFWERVSPFDIWWTPGAADIENASIIERSRLSRADINDLLDIPGYNIEEVRAVLDEYGRGGLSDNWDMTDSERALNESRENPVLNNSGMITCLEFNGNVQGRLLLEQGMDAKLIPDGLRDYMVQAWLIGTHVIKVQFTPSPRKRHNYFITSFEKMPGTPVGNGLTDIIADLQEGANSTYRALMNNMAIASGPQVMVNDSRLSAGEDGEELYPWKRWHYEDDPVGGAATQVPISFFQPNSIAQELLTVYDKINAMADDLSAIPRYLQGNSAGGAGRTSSGLAMLMGNASKILQTVAANIDRDVFDPLLTGLYDIVMMTDKSGLLTGNEQVRVMGVTVAIQRETQRSRQLEFLQITANPIDVQIMGPEGRAQVLRTVSEGIGMPGTDIVPPDDVIKERMAQQQATQQAQDLAQNGAKAQGNQAPQGGNVTGDAGPRVSIAGGPH